MASSSKKLTVSECECPIFLPEEIITDILTRVPVKSLLRFRCVSKPWLSLISCPRFVKTHLHISSNLPRIMLNIGYPSYRLKHCSLRSLISELITETIDNDFPEKHPKRAISVVDSCNGLVCIFIGHIEENDLFLWNPCTRNYKKLPPGNVEWNILFCAYGFGYNKLNDDYEVLGVFTTHTHMYESEVKMYSSRTNSWKMIGDFGAGLPVYSVFCKFVAGKFHLCTCPADSFDLGFDPPILFNIVSFDLENEVYGVIEQPNYGDGVVDLSLEVLGGCICVLCNKETHADVWVMKEYGVEESWSKTVTIPYFNYPGKSLYSKPLVMLPSGEILLVSGSRFVVYDPKDNSIRVPGTRNLGNLEEADVYVESLVSPTQNERIGRQDQ